MNRRSITGPLFLVGIGILLLVYNIAPAFPIGNVLRNGWPFLLIAVGVIGLCEVLYHASQGNPIPPRPVAGWFWLIVVFGAFGSWGYRSHNLNFGRFENGGVSLFGTNYEYEVNGSTEAAGVRRVIFENLKGNLNVKGGDTAQISVSGHRTLRAYSRSEADRANASSIRFDRQGESLLVRADMKVAGRTLDTSADLEITIPKGATVEARDRSGDVSIDDIEGSVDISNGRGDIRINNVGRDIKIDTRRSNLIHVSNVKGLVEVQGRGDDLQLENIEGPVTVNGEYGGTLEFRALAGTMHFQSDRTDFRVEAIPGSVKLDLGDLNMRDVTGPVRFQTKNRDVTVEDVTGSLEIMVERGDLQINPGKVVPVMDVHTHNGNIDLMLPEHSAFELTARAEQGEVDNQYGAALTESSGRTASARGLVGRGPKVVVVTDRGTVSIKKG